MATFTNQATLTYNGGTTTSNVAVGELVEVLSVTKTPVRDTYQRDDELTYVVTLRNTGTTPLTGLTVTDDLGGYPFGTGTVYPLAYEPNSVLYYQNGVLQATPTVTAGPPMTITGIEVPAGGEATIVYQVTTTEYAPLGDTQSIVNTATATGAGLAQDATAAANVTADTAPDLTIDKALSPATVSENGRLTYTFTVRNYGATAVEAGDNATITDTFDPRLTDLSVTFNGAAAQPDDYTYDEATGVFATTDGRIEVPAATYTQDPTTGVYTTVPGTATVTVTGTV